MLSHAVGSRARGHRKQRNREAHRTPKSHAGCTPQSPGFESFQEEIVSRVDHEALYSMHVSKGTVLLLYDALGPLAPSPAHSSQKCSVAAGWRNELHRRRPRYYDPISENLWSVSGRK